MAKLPTAYLFREISRRKKIFMEKNPTVKVISLGIGDTTEPLPPHVMKGLVDGARKLGTRQGFLGYGDEPGFSELREKIAQKMYGGKVDAEEIFVSDGAKPDIGRFQILFGNNVSVAVQDPAYPVYVDSSVIMGQTGGYDNSARRFDNLVYMPCTPENDFFPDLEHTPRTDLIFFCSPNNPTGAVATRDQLRRLVDFARNNNSIIIFDAAYREFISDPELPKTIFEIEGAREVAIELNSFSKLVGFTGVRLGWSIVPNQLKYDDGSSVKHDWNRVVTTIFNGASNVVQYGGLAALDDEGMKEMERLVSYYVENARIIKEALGIIGLKTYGGSNSPYIWVKFEGETSWDAFSRILQQTCIVTTPGSGFGMSAEGYIRFSAFGHRSDIEEAVRRFDKLLPSKN
jgi:LL-diaminopimelate aminotransferase